MVIGANLRFGSGSVSNTTNGIRTFSCPSSSIVEATVLLTIALSGVLANGLLMILIIGRASLRRWSQGLIFHQAVVDFSRAAMLVPLAFSLFSCQPVFYCSILETAFLLMATVSAVNLLTIVLSDTPIMLDDDVVDEADWAVRTPFSNHWLVDDISALDMTEPNLGSKILDAPHCALFGVFMIWFAAITVNLGPTFITGALTNHAEVVPSAPSCPLIQTAHRHYIMNLLWVIVNSLCLAITAIHLYRLYRDIRRCQNQAIYASGLISTAMAPFSKSRHSQLNALINQLKREGVRRIRMFAIICAGHLLLWGPLFLVVSFGGSGNGEGRVLAAVGPPKDPLYHQVTLYVSFLHSCVNAGLFMGLHRELRTAAQRFLCCYTEETSYSLTRANWSRKTNEPRLNSAIRQQGPYTISLESGQL